MDVYALGATMFKILTGERAPEAADILNEGFPAYELQKHQVSNALIACVARAMAAFMDGQILAERKSVEIMMNTRVLILP